MKRGRYHCLICGHGFLALGTDETKFCKKKCKMEYYKRQGLKWKPDLWVKRTKPMSTDEKLAFIKTLVFK